jgi:Ice-binding-like
MSKEIHLTKSLSSRQSQGHSKLFIAVWSLVLLFGAITSGCQKDSSTDTSPNPALSPTPAIIAGSLAVNRAFVNLKTAADFTILAETGISTTGVTSITGDIGVSPIAGTAITGFGLIMNTDNQSSHTPIVTGQVYAANYAAPTPSKMTTAISDMKTAFTTANGLTSPAPVVEKYAGDLSGQTLRPGLYKWSTGVLVTGVGTTLSGGPNDVWVFQIAQNLTVRNGAIIHLLGGAQAKNIYWVVSGKATLGTTVNFSGVILSKTLISVNTGAKVTGRLLAQTAVTLIASSVKP